MASQSTNSFPAGIKPQYVRTVGDSLGVVNLTPAALQCLADKLTEFITRCSKTAYKVAVQSGRRKMLVHDLESALRMLCIEMPIGSLFWSEPILRQLRMPDGEQLFIRENPDIDVLSLIQHPKLKLPRKRHIRLALSINVNDLVDWIRVNSKEEPSEKKVERSLQASGATFSALPAALRKRELLRCEILSPSLSFRLAAQGIPKKERILIKSFSERFSVEQQVYLTEIVEACVGQDDKKRQQALQSLERDTGIQVLLPMLSRLMYTSIRCSIVQRCLSMSIYIVRMMRSLALNKSVKLDGVLHEFLPSLISCMVCRFLCTRPDLDNHWALRDFASKTLIIVINDHGTDNIRRRSFFAVKKVFDDPSSSYSMIYGTIGTLVEFATPVEIGFTYAAQQASLDAREQAEKSFCAFQRIRTSSNRVHLHQRIMVLLKKAHSVAVTSADQQEGLEAHKLYTALTKHESTLRRLIKQASSKGEHMKTEP